MTFDEDWRLLRSTREWLANRGYSLAETRGPEGLESGLDRYSGPHLSIMISADRGQWFLEIRPNRIDAAWANLESWSACLGEPTLFHDARPTTSDEAWAAVLANSWHLGPQLDYLRAHLDDIETACGPRRIGITLDCLSAVGRVTDLLGFLRRPSS
jgi:hypothetical protein